MVPDSCKHLLQQRCLLVHAIVLLNAVAVVVNLAVAAAAAEPPVELDVSAVVDRSVATAAVAA